MIDWILITLIVLGIIFHEFGHWIYLLRITKQKPKIAIAWYGIEVGDRDQIKELTLKQYAILMGMGILFGLPFFMWNGSYWLLLYFLMSSFDFHNIIVICQVRKDYKLKWDTKVCDIPCERCIKSIKY